MRNKGNQKRINNCILQFLCIMTKRKPLEIKKQILKILKEQGELSLQELDIKVNTSYQTIRDQIEELEYFGKVEIIKHPKSKKTGRPYTTFRLSN